METNMKILDITGEYFKGIKKEKTFKFDGKKLVLVKGRNGSGKTTLFDMFMFVFCNTDADNKSNPNIRPNDVEECTPTVTINMEINDRLVKICKMQTMKKSKPDANGNCSIALTNTYAINDVPKTERDFKADLELLGLDLKRMAYLTNPDVFMALDKKEQRAILFSMADTSLTDYDIASKTQGCELIAPKLVDYKIEEIEAMNKATLKKIAEVYGKNGEILNAQIAGLEMAKVDIDVSVVELERAEISRAIDEIVKKQNDLLDASKNADEINASYMKAKFDLGSLETKYNQKSVDIKRELENKLNSLESELRTLDKSIETNLAFVKSTEVHNTGYEETRKNIAEKYKSIRSEVISEDSVICPTCGQSYPTERIEQITNEFAERKAKRLAELEALGKDAADMIAKNNTLIAQTNNEIYELIVRKGEITAEIDAIKTKLASPIEVEDYTQNDDYKALADKVAKLESAVANLDALTITTQRNVLYEKWKELRNQLTECDSKIASWKNNANIDEQIANLREKQSDYEQQKADCDETNYQLDLLKRAKNNYLTESINRHFKTVKFAFWELYKNGEYKENVIAYADGKRLGESMNTALIMRSKIDICEGLSSFFGQNIPIFVDGFESIDTKNASLIDVKNQLIALSVSDDEELTIN